MRRSAEARTSSTPSRRAANTVSDARPPTVPVPGARRTRADVESASQQDGLEHDADDGDRERHHGGGWAQDAVARQRPARVANGRTGGSLSAAASSGDSVGSIAWSGLSCRTRRSIRGAAPFTFTSTAPRRMQRLRVSSSADVLRTDQ